MALIVCRLCRHIGAVIAARPAGELILLCPACANTWRAAERRARARRTAPRHVAHEQRRWARRYEDEPGRAAAGHPSR